MLSGRKAFSRSTAVDTISAVLKEEPPELTGTVEGLSPAREQFTKAIQIQKDYAAAYAGLASRATFRPTISSWSMPRSEKKTSPSNRP